MNTLMMYEININKISGRNNNNNNRYLSNGIPAALQTLGANVVM